MIRQLWQFVFFQIQWWCCLLSTVSPHYHDLFLLALVLAVYDACRHFKTPARWLLFLLIASLGLINDTLLMHVNILYFFDDSLLIIPPWLLVLWLCFGGWFLKADWINNNYFLMALLGALGGPLSYFAGFKLGAISFPQPLLLTMIILSVDWLLLALTLTTLNGLCRK
ncbi:MULTISPECIES: DUF2878 domain-containing protein [unclassified Legionella]|uniref:DUF2878 domain-containing protein n=1 Tax=unclassified Legionella TaxID=2622702 RepID=UPI003AF818A6